MHQFKMTFLTGKAPIAYSLPGLYVRGRLVGVVTPTLVSKEANLTHFCLANDYEPTILKINLRTLSHLKV